jgi:EAL domain-containing protein (putative c-di-GMP-specific phosphodiesterase class I)
MPDEISFAIDSKTFNLKFLIQPIISYKDKCVFAYECLSIVKESESGEVQNNDVFFQKLCDQNLELLAINQISLLSNYENQLDGCFVSINIPISLMMKIGFLENLHNSTKLNIAIEITNVDFNLSEIELVYDRMKFLKSKLNLSFWLDDYVVNKVSHEFLMYLPWDIIKLDKSVTTAKSKLLVNLIYIVNLGFDLQENVIVEGIEDISTHEEIVKHNLKAQGYLYGKPNSIQNYIRQRQKDADKLIRVKT